MFGQLFSGMNVSNMNVNFNFGGNQQPIQNPFNNNNYGNLIGQPSNGLLLENKNNNPIKFNFDKTYIDSSYTFVIGDDFDTSKKPAKEFDTFHDYYLVTEYAGQHGYKHKPNLFAEIVNRKDKNPPIVTLLDYEEIENKGLIDLVLFNAKLLAKYYKHEKFFIVFETSGVAEDGEPFFVTFSKTKALFKKEIYSIKI